MRAKVEDAGTLLVETLEELGDVIELQRRCIFPGAAAAAVMTESGAYKALALDLCEQAGLPLATLTDVSAPALRAALPPFVPVRTPWI